MRCSAKDLRFHVKHDYFRQSLENDFSNWDNFFSLGTDYLTVVGASDVLYHGFKFFSHYFSQKHWRIGTDALSTKSAD